MSVWLPVISSPFSTRIQYLLCLLGLLKQVQEVRRRWPTKLHEGSGIFLAILRWPLPCTNMNGTKQSYWLRKVMQALRITLTIYTEGLTGQKRVSITPPLKDKLTIPTTPLTSVLLHSLSEPSPTIVSLLSSGKIGSRSCCSGSFPHNKKRTHQQTDSQHSIRTRYSISSTWPLFLHGHQTYC